MRQTAATKPSAARPSLLCSVAAAAAAAAGGGDGDSGGNGDGDSGDSGDGDSGGGGGDCDEERGLVTSVPAAAARATRSSEKRSASGAQPRRSMQRSCRAEK